MIPDNPSPVISEHRVTVYGQQLFYRQADGRPSAGPGVPGTTVPATVVLLHAAGADADEWSQVLAPLASRLGARVIAPDLPGHGRSDHPLVPYRLGTLADFLAGFCRQLGLARASLVGHSASGAAAVRYALACPHAVERLVLLDSGYGYALPVEQEQDPARLGHNPGTLRLLNPATRPEAKALLALAVADPALREDDAAVDALWTKGINAAWAMGKLVESWKRREDTLDGLLGDLRAPTLVLWGREDRITPVAMAERFANDIAGARVHVFERCGHSANEEQPEAFVGAVAEFLRT